MAKSTITVILIAFTTLSTVAYFEIKDIIEYRDLYKERSELLELKSNLVQSENYRLKRIALQLFNYADLVKIKKDTNLVKDLLVIGYNN